ncbi:MAG: hypothetical protein NVS2B16_34370 [Chloroflexota bacterium]
MFSQSVRAFALAAVLTIAGQAGAQSPISLGLAAGASFPTGDVSNQANTGYNIQGSIAAHVPAAPIGFRADVLFNQFGGKGLAGGGNLNILGVNGNATIGIPVDIGFSPYLIGGIGYYHLSGDKTASDDKFGVNGGIGTRFGLAGFSTFAEVRYHNIFSTTPNVFATGSSTQFIPLTFGIMF